MLVLRKYQIPLVWCKLVVYKLNVYIKIELHNVKIKIEFLLSRENIGQIFELLPSSTM